MAPHLHDAYHLQMYVNNQQCVAACCKCCIVLHCVALTLTISSVLQRVAACCSVLQCVAMCCIVLHCVALPSSVLQCVAVCSLALQCIAVYCSVLQCVAVCCSVLQCVAVCCTKPANLCQHSAAAKTRSPKITQL